MLPRFALPKGLFFAFGLGRIASQSDGRHMCVAYVVMENLPFHKFIIRTMILL